MRLARQPTIAEVSDALWRRASAALHDAGASCPASKPETEQELGELCNLLVCAYRSRSDELCFTLLCELCLPFVHGLARSLQRRYRAVSSDELLGNTLASMFKHLDQFDPRGPSAFFRWLSIIIKNHARMAARSYRRRRKLETLAAVREHDRSADPALKLEQHEERAAAERHDRRLAYLVRDCVARLPVLTKRIWKLRMEHGLQYQDIAARLGVTEGVVAMRLKRTKDAIRRALGDQAAWDTTAKKAPRTASRKEVGS